MPIAHIRNLRLQIVDSTPGNTLERVAGPAPEIRGMTDAGPFSHSGTVRPSMWRKIPCPPPSSGPGTGSPRGPAPYGIFCSGMSTIFTYWSERR